MMGEITKAEGVKSNPFSISKCRVSKVQQLFRSMMLFFERPTALEVYALSGEICEAVSAAAVVLAAQPQTRVQ